MDKNKKTKVISIVVIIILIILGIWYYKFRIPYNNAKKELLPITDEIKNKNEILDEDIKNSEEILATDEKLLYEDTRTNLQVAISQAKETLVELPEVPKNTNDVIEMTNNLKVPDYNDTINNLNVKTKEFTDSIKQLKQVTNPNSDFIVTRLNDIDLIKNIELVTEDNDPNNNLNKPKGYTTAAFFSSTLINDENSSGQDLIDVGTDAGGSIEVYVNEEDANNRNEYLSTFDGPGMLNTGSHTVLGTIVIRTSSKLPASSQKKLESKIIESFIKLN